MSLREFSVSVSKAGSDTLIVMVSVLHPGLAKIYIERRLGNRRFKGGKYHAFQSLYTKVFVC